jgi:hypothetical protein
MAGIYLDPTSMYGSPSSNRLNRYVNNINYTYDDNGRTLINLEIRVNVPSEMTEDKLGKICQIMDGHPVDVGHERSDKNYTINQLRNICAQNRNTGSTTFLLKSAIVNPDCYIVVRDVATMTDLRIKYVSLINNDTTFGDIYRANDRREPKFKTLTQMEELRGHLELPVIFDSSCFF